MRFECSIGDVVIHKQSLVLRDAVSNERDQMAMVDTADDLDFGLEFALSLSTAHLQLLHSHFSSSNVKEVNYGRGVVCYCRWELPDITEDWYGEDMAKPDS
ncbi:hypothetical protein BHE74_00005470 [Ensete ventricosum]|nr:hypothetical protein BHE74_00005470 [Ensete ventricosum]